MPTFYASFGLLNRHPGKGKIASEDLHYPSTIERTTYALLGPKTLKGQPSLKDSPLDFAQDEALSTAGGWGRN